MADCVASGTFHQDNAVNKPVSFQRLSSTYCISIKRATIALFNADTETATQLTTPDA